MTSFPRSFDNKAPSADYYSLQYLTTSGENNKHISYGGYLRQRPLGRPVDTAEDWRGNDFRTEIAEAQVAGIDGFTVDLLSLDGAQWERARGLFRAARGSDFLLVPMPDAASLTDVTPTQLAGAVAELGAYSSSYRTNDGQLVVSAFAPEMKGSRWWAEWLEIMASKYGTRVSFVPTFLHMPTGSELDRFARMSSGFSIWGGRSPASAMGSIAAAQVAHDRGLGWMQPVALQDARPRSAVYDEARNSALFRLSWELARTTDAQWVQLLTWNDYAEGTAIAPSTHIGRAAIRLTAHYASLFHGRTSPTTPLLVLSHRIQFAGALPSGGQTSLMQLRPGSTAASDLVEVWARADTDGMLFVGTGTGRYRFDVSAGVSVVNVPLALGGVRASFIGVDGTAAAAVSPYQVVMSPVVQDLDYHVVDSVDYPGDAWSIAAQLSCSAHVPNEAVGGDGSVIVAIGPPPLLDGRAC